MADCCKTIEDSLSQDTSQGWAGYVIPYKLRNLKFLIKEWFSDQEATRKRKEKSLISELNGLQI